MVLRTRRPDRCEMGILEPVSYTILSPPPVHPAYSMNRTQLTLLSSLIGIDHSGVYLCIRCSGIHRSMGTHISKVKSIDLDIWQPEQMDVSASSSSDSSTRTFFLAELRIHMTDTDDVFA